MENITPTTAERIDSLERRLAAAISLIETMVEHEAKILENGGIRMIAQQVRERIALMKE